jgi:hypothetical protein
LLLAKLAPSPETHLKMPLCGLKPLKCVQQLKVRFLRLVHSRRELLGVSDGKPYPLNRNARLVGKFEFHRQLSKSDAWKEWLFRVTWS